MPDNPDLPDSSVDERSARDLFQAADDTTKELIRQILSKQREVQHLRRRPDIHRDILDIIKRTVQ